MENGAIVEEHQQKKGRHRKKLLYNSILQQMEFYFSDSNLTKDRFMSQLLENGPFIDIDVFLKFNKIQKLTGNIEDVVKAISKSENLELSEDKTKVFRKTPVQIKENTDECTIYIEHIKSDTTHDWLKTAFSDFGNIAYVSIPKYRNNNLNKGFAFVEFEAEEDAQKALKFFEEIGCKMSVQMIPDQLASIATYEPKEENQPVVEDEKSTENEPAKIDNKKRKERDSDPNEPVENVRKKSKATADKADTKEEAEIKPNEENNEDDRKKKKRLQKKKAYFKEIGLHILSKKEWKKMRNRYLNMQREKMKALKAHLYKSRFANHELRPTHKNEQMEVITNEDMKSKSDRKTIEFIPGVIVKVKLTEPSYEIKKLKLDLKTSAPEVKYIDVPMPSGADEIFLRFAETESANAFCNSEFDATKAVLEGEEEKQYWDKIQSDLDVKMGKEKKKQRGRDKLLKKAERELGKHIRFDEAE